MCLCCHLEQTIGPYDEAKRTLLDVAALFEQHVQHAHVRLVVAHAQELRAGVAARSMASASFAASILPSTS
jgi:hypothetical protein